MRPHLVLLGLALWVPAQAEQACPFPAQRPGVTLQLYFGQGSSGDRAWRDFLASTVSRAFPDGFTVYDASGQWRDPATGRLSRERTKVVEVFVANLDAARDAVVRVIDAYKRRFRQKSVGLLTSPKCGLF